MKGNEVFYSHVPVRVISQYYRQTAYFGLQTRGNVQGEGVIPYENDECLPLT